MPTRSAAFGIAAVRGAVPVAANTSAAIVAATARLLTTLLERNRLTPDQIVSAVLTATPDLDADFPAHAARRLGWRDVPLLCASEIPVRGSMPRVIRVLLTVSGVPAGRRLVPVYLDAAAALRPDLAPARRKSAHPVRVAIIGVGQIGGSIGLALARARARTHWRRVGFDRQHAIAVRALAAGAIDEIAPSLEEACRDCAVAVLAVPVDALPEVIARAAAALPRGAALVDTGSTRGPLRSALAAASRRGVVALGAHPLAGTSARGIAAARGDLFEGGAFAVVATARRVPQPVLALIRDVGASALRVGAGDHDRALARTSHLPYLVAGALREVGGEAAAAGLSGPGWRDMTRLADSDPVMAEAYCRANAGEIAAAWGELERAIRRRVTAVARRRGGTRTKVRRSRPSRSR